MRIHQSKWEQSSGWAVPIQGSLPTANLVLAFGSRAVLANGARFAELREAFPDAHILCGSTAGEILNDEVLDDSVVISAVAFEHTQIRAGSIQLNECSGQRAAGEALGEEMKGEDLALVFVLADGQNVNGSALVEGLNAVLQGKVPVTGGLAGDGAAFEQTLVGMDCPPGPGTIAAIGFYGKHLCVGHGMMGGWDTFGPKRKVTRSVGNVLYELDGKSVLALYKDYLGEQASELPGSALLFPLSMELPGSGTELVRTVLSVDEAEQSMTFAGDIEEGARVQLMRANFDRLIDGAGTAARRSLTALQDFTPELAILISCVGRKLILGQRVEEEVEHAHEILGTETAVTGFYSYGEISPMLGETGCSLHNQTMTITTLKEL